jgi:hypothetical protein
VANATAPAAEGDKPAEAPAENK